MHMNGPPADSVTRSPSLSLSLLSLSSTQAKTGLRALRGRSARRLLAASPRLYWHQLLLLLLRLLLLAAGIAAS